MAEIPGLFANPRTNHWTPPGVSRKLPLAQVGARRTSKGVPCRSVREEEHVADAGPKAGQDVLSGQLVLGPQDRAAAVRAMDVNGLRGRVNDPDEADAGRKVFLYLLGNLLEQIVR